MLDVMQRNEALLKIARDITQRGAQIMAAFDDIGRMDWFDNTASAITEIVYADLGIPSRFLDDDTGNLVLSYMDDKTELAEVMDRLRELQILVTGGEQHEQTSGEHLAER